MLWSSFLDTHARFRYIPFPKKRVLITESLICLERIQKLKVVEEREGRLFLAEALQSHNFFPSRWS